MKNDKEEQNNNKKEEIKTNQPEDINIVMQGYMIAAIICTACMMMEELMFTVLPREIERLKQTMDRYPTLEDWEDLFQALGERASDSKCLQRTKDREKIRLMVFGKGNGNPVKG